MNPNAFADGAARGLGMFMQVQGHKDRQEEKAYNRKMQKQLFDMRLEDREYQRGRDKVADERHQEGLDYRNKRDGVMDQRYQNTLDYRDKRDAIGDSRWQQNFDASKGIRALQTQNLQGQINDRKRKNHQANIKRISTAYSLAYKEGNVNAMNALKRAYIGAWNTNPARRQELQKGAAEGHTKVMTDLDEQPGGRLLPEITTYDQEGNEVSVSALSRDRSSRPDDPYMTVDRDAIFGDVMNDPDMAEYMIRAESALNGISDKGSNQYRNVARYNEFGEREGEDVYLIDKERGGLVPMPILGQPSRPVRQPAPNELPEGMTAQHIASFLRANPGATRKDAINAWTAR
ncbi:hypothetical protein NX722_28330 [Endozoicomonas gorgoniicola]|uniref:Uncharacterized protein n=1 Tax=Endozoicomonas gorgoniicola TaxID=1234144 RepID=A0ABT3N4B5_9GAMM|nr:hypothetical protein [Endozoicomonas gorgoniicola]MCW7551074.1 hypothetical protein [Endozoicomonas gorgoniicola]MCW7556474.1 hypothetical protein [Endozoicomonas gorgoniicola]